MIGHCCSFLRYLSEAGEEGGAAWRGRQPPGTSQHYAEPAELSRAEPRSAEQRQQKYVVPNSGSSNASSLGKQLVEACVPIKVAALIVRRRRQRKSPD